jgi:hypothetical protein
VSRVTARHGIEADIVYLKREERIVKHILEKLGASDRTEAVTIATR